MSYDTYLQYKPVLYEDNFFRKIRGVFCSLYVCVFYNLYQLFFVSVPVIKVSMNSLQFWLNVSILFFIISTHSCILVNIFLHYL